MCPPKLSRWPHCVIPLPELIGPCHILPFKSSFFYLRFLLLEKPGGEGVWESSQANESESDHKNGHISTNWHPKKLSIGASESSRGNASFELESKIAWYIVSAPQKRFIYSVCTATSIESLGLIQNHCIEGGVKICDNLWVRRPPGRLPAARPAARPPGRPPAAQPHLVLNKNTDSMFGAFARMDRFSNKNN